MNTRHWTPRRSSGSRLWRRSFILFMSWSCAVLLALASGARAQAGFWDEVRDFRDDALKKGEEVIEKTIERIGKEKSKPTKPTQESAPGQTGSSNAHHNFDQQKVARAQELLNSLGYEAGVVDGVYGARTRSAIEAFEGDRGLPLHGNVTDTLIARLEQEAPQPVQSVAGSGTQSADASGTVTARGISRNTACQSATALATLKAQGSRPVGAQIEACSCQKTGTGVAGWTCSVGWTAPVAGTTSDAAAVPAHAGQPPAAPVPVNQDTAAQGAVQNAGTSAPAQAGAPGSAALAAEFGMRTRLGRPVIVDPYASSEGVVTDGEAEAMARFFTLLRLRLNPHLGRYSAESSGDAANCLANRYLEEQDKDQILAAPDPSIKGVRKWKGAGSNEFEVNRATTRYNEEFLPEIISRGPGLPMAFVYVARVHLQPYDLVKGGFALDGMPQSGGGQHTGGLTLPPPDCLGHDKDYLPFATALPEFWPIEAERAESLVVSRISVDEAFPDEQRRKVFAAVKFTLSAAPKANFDANYHRDRENVPMTIGIESVALYEDPGLQRHLHTFGIDNPAPAVLLAGMPDSLPRPDRSVLDEETVALLLLKQRGDILDREAWEALARRSSRNDEEYYDKTVTRIGGGGAHHRVVLETYDPAYVPFFPPGISITHGRRMTNEQLMAFKAWSLKRAGLLPDRFVLRGRLVHDRDAGVLRLALGQSDGRLDSPALAANVLSLGYAPGQVLRPDLDDRRQGVNVDTDILSGAGKRRVPVLVLANLLKAYQPGISPDELETLYGSKGWSYPVEVELRMERTELAAVDSQQEAFLLHAQPLVLRALSQDASTSIYEQTYQVAALDPSRSTNALTVAPPDNETMPLSAEVADLLVAKFLPGAVDDAMIARMMLARWHYENGFNGQTGEPQWGRFFIEGKPRPDAAQREEFAAGFRDWTLKRAEVMPRRVTAVFRYARIGDPGPLKLGVGLDSNPNALNIQLNSCRTEALGARRDDPALAQTLENACLFLEDAATIPGREIYIGTAGGSVRSLFVSRRERTGRSNASLYASGIGPRWVCGGAMRDPDPYCRAMLAELGSQGELAGQAWNLDDVLVTDKEVHVPEDRPDIASLRPSQAIVELDLEISGVRRTEELPAHPLIAAYEAHDSFAVQAGLNPQGGSWLVRFHEDIVPLFLFDARVTDARLVEPQTGEHVAKLELREPRQPDPGLLQLVEPERFAPPDEPWGPDVVGVRLGMSFDEADRIIREHMPVGRALVADRAWQTRAAAGKIAPFTSGRLYESRDGTDSITIFDEPPAAPNVVLGIVRLLNLDKGKVAPAAIYAQLDKKYGTASGLNPSGSGQLWLEDTEMADPVSGRYCYSSHNAPGTHGIWRDPDAGAEDPAPAPPVYGAGTSGTSQEGLQDYLAKQQEYMNTLQKQQQDQLRYGRGVPGLDCLGCDDPVRTAECPAGLATDFDVRGSREWDQLVIRVFDYRVYTQQFSQSNRMIEKGEGEMKSTDAGIDVKL